MRVINIELMSAMATLDSDSLAQDGYAKRAVTSRTVDDEPRISSGTSSRRGTDVVRGAWIVGGMAAGALKEGITLLSWEQRHEEESEVLTCTIFDQLGLSAATGAES
jgi:hypothetical protein